MSDPLAIIAGSGRFPIEVAEEARRQGRRVVAIGLEGWADPALAQHADVYEPVAVGQLARLIDRLKAHGIRQAVMAGKVTKQVLFDQRVSFDPATLILLAGIRDFSVNGLLGAIAASLAKEGITLLDSSTYLQSRICPEGVLTRRGPTPQEQRDIRLGVDVARTLAGHDVGQTVVVKQGVIAAVEALEGTDAAIRRAAQVAGQGLVVVKMASPSQDRRFDLPVVGLQTAAMLNECDVTCLALEAGSALLLDRDGLLAAADAAGRCVTGIRVERPVGGS